MSRKPSKGLVQRKGIWHIDKTILGHRICRSCKTSSLKEAELLLAKLTDEVRRSVHFGDRPVITFEAAAAKYILDHADKKSIRSDIHRLENLVLAIGDVHLSQVHQGSIQPWIDERKAEGKAAGTINHGIKIVNRILRLASSKWINEFGQTWIEHPKIIELIPDKNKREPYPLDWEEQRLLFSLLPDHLKEMALFAVNTGCRDQEICKLSWAWEIPVPELNTSVFLIPGNLTKNGDDRLVVLNRVAESVVERCRGKNESFVFTYRGEPTTRIMNKAWLRARNEAEMPWVRVHDLKHTYGRRLRAAGVGFEDRQDLLGHRSNRITTHYSAPELAQLIQMSNLVCELDDKKPQLVILKRKLK